MGKGITSKLQPLQENKSVRNDPRCIPIKQISILQVRVKIHCVEETSLKHSHKMKPIRSKRLARLTRPLDSILFFYWNN